jgi:hypothetical protein
MYPHYNMQRPVSMANAFFQSEDSKDPQQESSTAMVVLFVPILKKE